MPKIKFVVQVVQRQNFSAQSTISVPSTWQLSRNGRMENMVPSIFCDRRRSHKCVSKWSQTIAQLYAIYDRLRSYENYVITAIKGSFIDITTIMRINIALFPRQKVEMRWRMRSILKLSFFAKYQKKNWLLKTRGSPELPFPSLSIPPEQRTKTSFPFNVNISGFTVMKKNRSFFFLPNESLSFKKLAIKRLPSNLILFIGWSRPVRWRNKNNMQLL